MNNLTIAQRLRALADAVKNAPQEWGTVGVGGDTVEKLVFVEHENVHVLEVRLTPPPQEKGQNVAHRDDDDGDDEAPHPMMRLKRDLDQLLKEGFSLETAKEIIRKRQDNHYYW